MQIAYRTSDTSEAHIIAGMLHAEGIQAHVGGHHLQGGMGELAAIDFAHIFVDNEQLEDARAIIATYEQAGIKQDSETDEETSVQPRKWLTLLFVISFAMMFALIWIAIFVA
jgi:hypothetical protein